MSWPSFILVEGTPYRVISTSSSGFLALDMIDREVKSIAPSLSFGDPYFDRMIWIPELSKTGRLEFFHAKHARIHKFFYDYHYKLHRDDGPAQIICNEDNTDIIKIFWLHGKKYQNAEAWFNDLSEDQRKVALFNMDEVT